MNSTLVAKIGSFLIQFNFTYFSKSRLSIGFRLYQQRPMWYRSNLPMSPRLRAQGSLVSWCKRMSKTTRNLRPICNLYQHPGWLRVSMSAPLDWKSSIGTLQRSVSQSSWNERFHVFLLLMMKFATFEKYFNGPLRKNHVWRIATLQLLTTALNFKSARREFGKVVSCIK